MQPSQRMLSRMWALATISRREARELASAARVRRRIDELIGSTTPRPAPEMLVSIVDALRPRHGVEAVCAELPLPAQDYYAAKARAADARWRRLFGRAPAQRSAGSSVTTNSRPTGICSVDPSRAVPTG
ncbi:MAG: hypothetical protein U1F09_15210 [Steroidobacteraceae bacterium]